MKRVDKSSRGWQHYELLDCGEGRKLERFGSVILDRPDPQALWKKYLPQEWTRADASFTHTEKGVWNKGSTVPEEWSIKYDQATFMLSFGGFKHIGLFPEHNEQWAMLSKLAKNNPRITMLNLFGYTGVASIVAALNGAIVTHVDASKQTIASVKENSKQSGLSSDALRLVCEDALKYVKRLVARGERFDVIVMDPPAFGRGPKGEVWKIEEKLAELLALIPSILSPNAKRVIVNGYAAGYSARTFGELLQEAMSTLKGTVTYGDIGIEQKNYARVLSTGIYAEWEPQ